MRSKEEVFKMLAAGREKRMKNLKKRMKNGQKKMKHEMKPEMKHEMKKKCSCSK
jgi:hypothetical protein